MDFSSMFNDSLPANAANIDSFINILPVALAAFDKASNLISCNDKWAKLFGFDNKETLLKHLEYPSSPSGSGGQKTADLLRQKIEISLKEKSSGFELLTENADTQPIYLDITLAHEIAGAVIACAIEVKKHNDSTMAPENHSHPEDFSLAMLESLPIAATIIDKTFKARACNLLAAKMYGDISIEFCLANSRSLYPAVQPDGRNSDELLKNCFEKAVIEGHSKVEKFVIHKLDGSPLWVEITYVRIQYKGEYEVIAYRRDITEELLAKEMEQEALLRQQLLYDSNPIPASLWDKNLNVIDCNETMVKILKLESKRDYIERFFDYAPEYQSDGTKTTDKFAALFSEAYDNGYSRTIWLHQTSAKEPVPGDVVIVRIDLKDSYMFAAYMQDLRPLMEASEKISEIEKTNKLIIESCPMFIEMWDEDLNLIYCSPQTVKLFGLNSKEEYIERYYELSPPIQPDGTPTDVKAHTEVQKTFDEGYSRFEWMHIDPQDGSFMPVECILTRVIIDGKPVALGFTHDLRPYKEAENKIKEAEERAKLMLDATPMAVSLYDKNQVSVDCNLEALKMFQLSEQLKFNDIATETMPEYQPDGRRSKELLDAWIAEAFETGYAWAEFISMRRDGSLFPSEATWVRVKYKDDFVVVEYLRDLTETKAAIEREKEASEMSQMFMENLPISIELWDDEANLVYCNHNTVELFGLSSITEYVEDFFSLSPKYQPCGTLSTKKIRDEVNTALKEGHTHFEWMNITKSGEPLPIETTFVRVMRDGRYMIVGYNHDLRTVKQAAEEARLSEIAKEESRSKTRFLARMSHEIRTPLNVIKGVSEIQLRKEQLNPEDEDAFMRIHNSSGLLLALINDILDLSKVEAGKMEIVPGKYEVASMIVDTVQLNLMYIGSKRVEFKLDVDEFIPTHLIGDEIRIKQILNNLLSNAFKYTDEGSVSLSFSIESAARKPLTLSFSSDKDMVLLISVKDTGQGMSPEQIETMYDVFTRHNLDSNRGVEGSGLGLNIAYQLVNMMKGAISVESEPGKGSTFNVRIPQKFGSPIVLGKETAGNLANLDLTKISLKKMAKEPRRLMPHGKVLVVDDVESNLFVAKGFMAPYKLNVDTVNSGYAAIDKIRDGEVYDIIFMDHMMPGIDGIEATKIIRDMGYGRPIVALTANTVKGQAEIFLNNGFSDFISKPIDINSLDKCLMRFIGEKPAASVPHFEESTEDENSDINLDVIEELPPLPIELIEAVLRDVAKSMERLESIMEEASFDERALKNYAIQAHAMKSAMLNISQTTMSQAAYTLEQAAYKGDVAAINEKTPVFLSQLKKALKVLQTKK